MYNWQLKGWPHFKFDLSSVEESLLQIIQNEGVINGMLNASSNDENQLSATDLLIDEVLTNAAIEGEYLTRSDVRSSILNQLGINYPPEHVKDLRAKSMSLGLIKVREAHDRQLSIDMLYEWHQIIMEPYTGINKGQWRTGNEPMRMISGIIGKEEVHFEAPPSEQVAEMMNQFVLWYNTFASSKNALLNAPVFSAIAHLYFESIHPFEDGNGRIGRMLAVKALSKSQDKPTNVSISKAIENNRKLYYDELKKGQRTLDITEWIHYFIDQVLKGQALTIDQIIFVLKKTKYYDLYDHQFNERQRKVILKMMDAEPEGFKGGMSAKKYIAITKASKATATRDLQELSKIGAIKSLGSGRSTHYEIDFDSV